MAAGVPPSTPAEVKVTPAGSVPVSLNVGAGIPVAVAVKDPTAPTVNVVAAALVMAGAWLTVSVKFWVAFGVTPLVAVMVMGYVPPVLAAGVPLSTPDEKVTPAGRIPVAWKAGAGNPPAENVTPAGRIPVARKAGAGNPPPENVTPAGSVPVSLKVGEGIPVAVAVKDPAAPTVNVVLGPLVMAGAWLTVNVKFCVASGVTPLLAVMMMGYVPPVFAAGVPLSTPAEKVRPAGNVPVALKAGVGNPVAVGVNDAATPGLNEAVGPLVMAGAWLTVNVKFWVAFGATPLLAVMVIG